MKGADVFILRPQNAAKDSHGNLVPSYVKETVKNVLVNSPTTQEVLDSQAVTNGRVLSYSLGFPKTYTKSLYGCKVIIPFIDKQKEWYVIGDPQPIMHNCPTKWNRKVLVSAYE